MAVTAIPDIDSVIVTVDRRVVEVAGGASDEAVLAAIGQAGYEVDSSS